MTEIICEHDANEVVIGQMVSGIYGLPGIRFFQALTKRLTEIATAYHVAKGKNN